MCHPVCPIVLNDKLYFIFKAKKSSYLSLQMTLLITMKNREITYKGHTEGEKKKDRAISEIRKRQEKTQTSHIKKLIMVVLQSTPKPGVCSGRI